MSNWTDPVAYKVAEAHLTARGTAPQVAYNVRSSHLTAVVGVDIHICSAASPSPSRSSLLAIFPTALAISQVAPSAMPLQKSEFVSSVWKDNLFKDKVVFCTGGNGTICSAQVRALVHLGANACIVGRNEKKTEEVAKDIAAQRPGAKVIGIGGIDVRSIESLQSAVDRCVSELGGIDFMM